MIFIYFFCFYFFQIKSEFKNIKLNEKLSKNAMHKNVESNPGFI